MNVELKTIFRVIAILEGVSYILLLFIAVPIKYLLHNEQYVQMLGMPHGVLFMLYVIIAFLLQEKMCWGKKNMMIIMLGSIIPFGTFYVDYKYLK